MQIFRTLSNIIKISLLCLRIN